MRAVPCHLHPDGSAQLGRFPGGFDPAGSTEAISQGILEDPGSARRTARVFVTTTFRIPHAGGASTHIEMLVAVLRQRGLLEGVLVGRGVLGSVPRRVCSLPMRILDKDRTRARALEAIVRAHSRTIKRRVTPVPRLIIHAHDPLATCAALRCRPPGSVVVQTVHGPFSRELEMAGNDPVGAVIQQARGLETEAFKGASLLLPVDREQARILRVEYGVEERRIRIVENAVELERLSGMAEQPGGRRAVQRPFFLVPRRLVAKNGVEVAIKAFARLRRPDAALVIAGSGPLERALKTVARDLVPGDRCEFLGALAREELFHWYRSAVAVIIPSVPAFGVVEATSFVALEAMAIGVPVIASDIGGLREIIVDSSRGVLVPPGDDAALAGAMRHSLEMGPGERLDLISAARARVGGAFDIHSWTSKLLDAYQEALCGV